MSEEISEIPFEFNPHMDINDIINLESNQFVSINIPKYISELIVNNDLHFYFTTKIPNQWNRFWMKFLLGWDWKSIEKDI